MTTLKTGDRTRVSKTRGTTCSNDNDSDAPICVSSGRTGLDKRCTQAQLKTGEQGTCMFAYTCMKSNGTHLGTCIDRFYFGSCCKLKGPQNDLIVENHINYQPVHDNQVFSSSSASSQTTPSSTTVFDTRYTIGGGHKNHSQLTGKPTNMVPISQTGSSHGGLSTVKTDVDSAQHLATETYYSTPTTEKLYIPIHTSHKPNKTENLSSSSGLFTTVHGSSSNIFSASKRPTTQSEGLLISSSSTPLPSTTTQSYYLSTFQVVHNENVDKTPSTVFTKVTTLSPSSPEPSTAWTPIKHVTTTKTTSTTPFRKTTTPGTVTKPILTPVTTKKPIKPVKPITTTRKPPTKKPTSKPAVKPSGSTVKPTTPVKKPVQTTFTHLVTTTKPSAPAKKPIQPTKKPVLSSPKPSTSKPGTTKPTVVHTKVNTTTISTSGRPSSSTTSTARTTTTTSKTTFTTRSPIHGTFTTTEVVFTKPGSKPAATTSTGPPSKFGITTFRPDLTPTSKKPGLVTGSHLTTFNYTVEGVKVPTTESSQSTISNEISSSETVFESIPEIQEENTNVIFQQTGTTAGIRPGGQNDTNGE
ncbi:hypothetical protein RUM44_006651 [Polyplax serrata]|uniref:Uncharacterized protein n=1 Tax=Polyplax serrata TaxID=468196 RepID=A0ABR1AIQ5_POLSC